jgi:putative ABC transport system permease protein
MEYGSAIKNELSMKANFNTPRWIYRLLSWFCPPHLFEEIEGDLIQKFERDVKSAGERRAARRLFWSALKFFRPEILLRNRLSVPLNQGYMFRSYFKVMIRNIARRKLHSAINVLGLTVGITFGLLIGVFVWDELQVNKNLKEVDQLFLLETRYKSDEGNMPPFFVPALLGPQAVEQFPNTFQNSYRFRDRSVTVSKGDKHFRLQSMIGDSTFFEMFGFPVLHGQADHALSKPNNIVVTEKIARQFFDRSDVVGESLTLSTEVNGLKEYVITAVLADLQKKNSVSDFMNSDAQIFLSQENRADFNLGFQDEWNTGIITYLKTTPAASGTEAATLINQLLIKDAPRAISENKTIELKPLNDYYLMTNHGAVQKLIISLTIIVVFIILLAAVNFVNISIAGSFSRLKEIGVRKVIGGLKKQVAAQFLTESVVLALFSGVLALFLYQVCHGYFGETLGVTLPAITELNFTFWIWIAASSLLIGLLAGAYPALYLSGTHTIESLKGKFKSVKGTIAFSRGLVAVQFLIAIFIFTASFIMSEQVAFVMQADLGYDKSNVMIVSSVPRMWNDEGFSKMDVAKREFLTANSIQSASLSWGAPNFNFSPYSARISTTGQSLDRGILTILEAADKDYADTYGLKLLDGKFFFDDGENFQPNRIVINQTAQKTLSAQVGDKVRIEFSDNEFTIVGIVKDFNFESFHESVKPVAFTHTRDFTAFRYFSFKLNPGSLAESVQEVESIWKKVFPNDPFVYAFTDERLALAYQTELQLKKASAIGSVLILIIVLTGVLGLVSLSVLKRSKEIGIRKVLGATATSILGLVSGEYARLLMVSVLAGVPLSYIFCLHWLNRFAYHINLTWWMFLVPILFLFLITILMVGAQSMKSALSNPVDTLRNE